MTVSYISGASNLVYNGFWFILEISSFIGQTLVNQILIILDVASRLFGLIVTFLRVVYKDSVFFFYDLTDNVSYFIAFVAENVINFRDGMIDFSSTVTYGIASVPSFFYEFINCFSSCLLAPVVFLRASLSLIWDGLLLIGSSFWLAVTNTPCGIFYCLTKFIERLHYMLNGIPVFFMMVMTAALSGMQNIFNFIYNIPYSSVLGLILSIILLYGFVRNLKKICFLTFKMFVICYQCVLSLLHDIWTGHFLKLRSSQNIDINLSDRLMEGKLCVVCQDRLKEVILLPCRHLCLCTYCKSHIIQNYRICPICRTNIESMMKVYV